MKLYFQECPIGNIDGVFKSDGTWWGTFSQSTDADNIPELKRALNFIQFCKDWNASQLTESPRDAIEFDDYADIWKSGDWTTADQTLAKTEIEHSPNFLPEGDISWIERAGDGRLEAARFPSNRKLPKREQK